MAILNKPKPFVKTYYKLLIFVRHGQYETGAESSDKKVLTEVGWQQARRAGKRLRELGYTIDCVVHSDMIRARQTTAAILAELDEMNIIETGIESLPARCPPRVLTADCPLEDWALCPSPLQSRTLSLLESASMAEGPPPVDPEPQSRSRRKRIRSLNAAEMAEHIGHQNRIQSSFTYHVHHRALSPDGAIAMDGPGACAVCEPLGLNPSLCACSRTLRNQPAEVILFVGHANVFRYWLCRALQLPPEAWLRISLPHGSFTELLFEQIVPERTGEVERTVTALRIGDDGHLPPELQSR
ncbi:unnamed protein product [Schistocephalus solidus]|uniref:Serine/threonine-protein phosphatase PGAM5, mitochondrial n=1 Tax=Schistocephalus solidus TaxID=70667 RepID=A0A183S9B8_SCHSO|nr:unnamed protein product [Schistocephalus solidus]